MAKNFKQFVAEQSIGGNDQWGCINKRGEAVLLVNWDRPKAGAMFIDNTDARKRISRKLAEGTHGDHIDDWTDHHDNDHLGGGTVAVGEHLAQADASGRGDSQAIRNYTADSKSLNQGLYHHHNEGTEPPDDLGGHSVKALDKALSKNKLAAPLNVYSGVRRNPGQLAKANGGKLHIPAYTSTTIDKDEARTFAHHGYGSEGKDHHIIHFHLPAGHTGKYVDHHSANGGESEFMLPRSTQWKINPKPDSYNNNDDTKTHVWHAHPWSE